jgi:hypothetical protein
MITANIESAILVKNDVDISLTNDINKLVISESISEKLVTAVLNFNDNEKIFEMLSFNGNEIIKFEINDLLNQDKLFVEYVVVSKINAYPEDSQIQQYSLLLIEKGYKKFIDEYSTSFKNKPISNFIANFSENALEKEITTIEQSVGNFTFAFPYQKFHYMLSYLNQYLTSINGYNTYFYFSTLSNGTYFTTLQNLIKKPNEASYYLNQNKFTQQSPLKVVEFSTFKKTGTFDIRNTLLSKQGSSRVQRYDYSTGKVIERNIKYSDVIKDYKLLGSFSIYSSEVMDKPTYTYYASTDNNKNETMIEEGLFTTATEQYEISFDGDLKRSCGNTCFIRFEDDTPTNTEPFSPKTGHYLMTSLTHTFTAENYTQSMTLIKNGYEYKTTDKQIKTQEI